ncbi:MAG: dephospho-CoA kinase [Actinomycetales bacterium]|nr:dephospho-CoA kinase [Actinomycetales bacterium]
MYLIGLTGGIASGKSTVARRLADHGAVVIDADIVAREVVAPGTPALAAIARKFGPTILDAGGALDRARLGSIVFGNSEQLEKLNAIVHPAVKLRTAELLTQARASNPDAVIVYDVPLLVEADVAHNYDEVVVASAPEDVRVQRMVELRGMTEEAARARIGAQASEAKRLAIADVVIDTGGGLQHTLAQVDALWARIGV